MYNIRGYYTPLTIDETLFVYLDKPTQTTWRKVQELHGKLATARESLKALEIQAQEAPQRDRDAAVLAVSEGKPAPKETTTAAREAVDACQREIDALITLADQTERLFVAETSARREDIQKAARKSLDADVNNIIESLMKVQEELGHVYRLNGLWQWGRGNDDAQLPGDWRITARIDSHKEDLRQILDTVIAALTKALPHEVEASEANLAAWNAQIRGQGATADGLVLDVAAYRAYR
jgi:uncharacterized damage-inducible protein DinB